MLNNCTIIIPTRNRGKDLRRTTQELINIGLADVPFLIMDDASDDPKDTESALLGLNHCRIMRNDQRTGQAEARNVLIQSADTLWCLCLDDDTFFTDLGCLPALTSQATPDERIGGYVFHTIREYDGFREFPEKFPRQQVHRFIGCGVMFRRDAYLAAGGYRGLLRYGAEEPDLAVRLWSTGNILKFEPSVKILHFHSQAARDQCEYHFLYARNTVLLHAMNYPGVYGLPLGVARSLKRACIFRSHWRSTFPGLTAGILDALLHRKQRTTLSYAQYRKWRQFVADCNSALRNS